MKRSEKKLWHLLFIILLHGAIGVSEALAGTAVDEKNVADNIRREGSGNVALSNRSSCEVTFKYVQPIGEYQPAYIAAYNKDVLIAPSLQGLKEDKLTLSSGKYDLIVVFDHLNSGYTFGKEGTVMVIKEGVEVMDGATYSFDALEATNIIKMVAYTPKGEICAVPTCQYIDSNWTKKEIAPGNIAETLVFKSVIHQEFGKIYNLSTNGGSANFIPGEISKKQHNSDDYLAFHVNNVSDKYMFQQLRFMPTASEGDDSYVVTLRQLGSKSGIVSNDWTDFFKIDESFSSSLNSGGLPRYPYSISFGMTENDFSPYSAGFSWVNDNVFHLEICPPPVFEGFETYQTQITFSKVEANLKDGMEYAINSAPLRFLNQENAKYYPVSANERYRLDSHGNSVVTPGPEDLAFTIRQRKQENGSGVPVAVFSYTELKSPFSPGVCPIMDIDYLGRLGERYNMDKALRKTIVTHNGTIILDENGGSLTDLGWNWNYPDGLVEVESKVVNHNIEGLQGTNISKVSFDQRKEDKFAPVLQMLQFRDKDENVTDHFFKDNIGEIILSGGDFIQKQCEELDNYGEPVYYFAPDVAPDIEVYYSKHNVDEMLPLEVRLIENDTPKPGFPCIWKGSLEGLEDDGWFDIEVKLTDAGGNYQFQKISPAFYIHKASNLSDLCSEMDNTLHRDGDILTISGISGNKIEVYSANGTLQMVTNDRQIDISSLPPGIYFIKDTLNETYKFIK